MWFLVHDIAPAEPRQIAVFLLIFLVLNLQQTFFSIFVLLSSGRSNSKVPIEVVIIYEVGTDTLEIHENIIKLLQNEEAGCHALAAWNCVAF